MSTLSDEEGFDSRRQRLPTGVRGYIQNAADAFQLAPLEVALGILTAVVFSVAMRRNDEELWLRIAAPVAIALPLLLGLSVLRARGVIAAGVRWAASAALLLACAAYSQWVFDPQRESEGWRFLALLGTAVMAVSLVPTVGGSDREQGRLAFWRFNGRLLVRIVTVVAYGAALFAALAGAVGAVSALFDLDVSEHLYADLAGAVFFALVPWVVAGGIPELIAAPAPAVPDASRLVQLLGRYLYAPVLLVYLVVLLAYAVRVIVTGEVPKNLLSPIILLAGLFGFLGSVFLEPLRREPDHAGVSRLIRLLPVPMLALLPFALWAVWVRRDQYGWTEFRYLRFALLIALSILAVLGLVRLLRRQEPLLRLIPVVLGATLLLSSFGPWGAVAVSRGSQQARLRAALAEAGVLTGNQVTRPLSRANEARRDTLTVPAETYDRIIGSLVYLFNEHGAEAVQPLLAADISAFEGGEMLLGALRLRPGCRTNEQVQYLSAILPDTIPIPGLPGGTLYRIQSRRPDQSDTTSVGMRLSGTEALITLRDPGGERVLRADLSSILARTVPGSGECVADAGPRGTIVLSATDARLPLLDATGAPGGILVLTGLGVVANEDSVRVRAGRPTRVEHLDGLVIVPPR